MLRHILLRAFGQGERLMLFSKQGVFAVDIRRERDKGFLSCVVITLLRFCAVRYGYQHSSDFLDLRRIGKLFLHLLHTFPIASDRVYAIRARLCFRHIKKSAVDKPCKLLVLIFRHSGTILIREKAPLPDHGVDSFYHLVP